MAPQLIPSSATSDSDSERRRDPRESARVQLDVTNPSAPAGNAAVAWARDVSQSGVCFRTLTRLESQRVRIQQRDGGRGAWAELEVVRERQLSGGLWEYGARLCSVDVEDAYEVSQDEFAELMSALQEGTRMERSGESPSQSNSDSVNSAESGQRSVLLSLRRVARRSAATAIETYRTKRRRARLRSFQGLLVVAGAALLCADFDGLSVPTQFWHAFTAAASAVFALDWHLACRLSGAPE
jgi:hypothetical protein